MYSFYIFFCLFLFSSPTMACTLSPCLFLASFSCSFPTSRYSTVPLFSVSTPSSNIHPSFSFRFNPQFLFSLFIRSLSRSRASPAFSLHLPTPNDRATLSVASFCSCFLRFSAFFQPPLHYIITTRHRLTRDRSIYPFLFSFVSFSCSFFPSVQ